MSAASETESIHFEIAIEQRLHGALPEADEAALEAHLARCEECRAYQASASAQQRALAAHAGDTAKAVDWAKVEQGLKRRIRNRIRGLLYGVVTALVVIPIACWGLASSDTELWSLLLSTFGQAGLLMVVRAVLVAREARQIARLSANQEMLAYHRRYLRRRLREIRWLRWVALGVVVMLICLIVATSKRNETVTYAFLLAVVASAWGYVLIFRYPRLARESEALEREPTVDGQQASGREP